MKILGLVLTELMMAERSLAMARKARELAGMVDLAILLTPRQYEIAKLVVTGMSEKAVARALSISPDTVNCHKKYIFAKLRIHNVKELKKFWNYIQQNKDQESGN